MVGEIMITIFARRELLVTMDADRQTNVCQILASNGIKYSVKVTNFQSPNVVGSSRARTGCFGINQNYSYEYKIFVHKKDYDNALQLIR